jgi:outer membrane protein TolC
MPRLVVGDSELKSGPGRHLAAGTASSKVTFLMKTARLIPLFLWAGTLSAQGPLTLDEAVRQALVKHPSIEAAAARIKAADARIEQARSGWMPKVSYQESYQRGNNPVYVFGALLTQRQFTAENFNIEKLNRPDALNNFQSQVVADQVIYDFGGTKSGVKAASLARQMSEEERKALEQQVIAGVARAYHGVTLAKQALEVAEDGLKSAEADLKRAITVRDAGMATDADVLSIQVHVSAMREQQIRRRSDLEIGMAALNEALGLPLDTVHELTTPLTSVKLAGEAPALQRSELRQVRLAADIAGAQATQARSQMLPVIAFRGVFEADRQQFVNKGGANWMIGASLRWNLFDGSRSKQMQQEAIHQASAARATEKQLQSALSLQVRKARTDALSAEERINVTEATVAQAEESQRILRNRYSAGLANVTDILRADTAVLDARTRRLAAIYDQRMAAIALDAAAGTLNGASDVLK